MSVRDLRTMGRRIEAAAERGAEQAAAAVAPAAEAGGAMDVGYAFTDTPLGRLLVAVTKRGLVRLAYPGEHVDATLAELARTISPRVLESTGWTGEARRELDEYFEGRRTGFDLVVDLSGIHGFHRRILEATSRIPFGRVATYREVATEAGSERATRAAGNALGSNPIPIVVPCHRVLRTGGGLGGYTGGIERKVALLTLEGVLQRA